MEEYNFSTRLGNSPIDQIHQIHFQMMKDVIRFGIDIITNM